MIKRFNSFKSGYTSEKAAEVVDLDQPFVNVTVVPEPVRKYDEVNHKYGEKIGYNYYAAQPSGQGQNPIRVKILGNKQKSKFGDQVLLNNLVACEVNGNIYFKADSITKVED